MRAIVIFIFILLYCNNTYSQKSDENLLCSLDTLNVTGYFIIIQTQEDINEIAENNKKREKGEPYNLIYSLSGLNSIFIPFDTLNCKELSDGFFENRKNAYVLYSDMNMISLKSFRGLEDNFLAKWPDFNSSDYYISSAGENIKYCIQIFSLSAQWVKLRLLSRKSAYDFIGRKAQYLKKDEPFYDIYVLKKVFDYNNFPDIMKLPIKHWKSL